MHVASNPAFVGNTSKVARYEWGAIRDQKPALCWIDKAALFVDHTYQRDATEKKVVAIARDFSWAALGAICVAKRDRGQLYVFEGQHRVLAAMKRVDITSLPCLVFESMGVSDEAAAFLRTNSLRRPVNANERYRALLVTNDPDALHVQTLITQCGRTPGTASSSGVARCLNLLLDLARSNRENLNQIFPVAAEICVGHPLHERIVDGLSYLNLRMPDGESIADRRWRQRLVKVGYDDLHQAIGRAAAFYSRGGSKVFAAGILSAVNKGLVNKLEIDGLG